MTSTGDYTAIGFRGDAQMARAENSQARSDSMSPLGSNVGMKLHVAEEETPKPYEGISI